jgi:Tol biopolymer transport system component
MTIMKNNQLWFVAIFVLFVVMASLGWHTWQIPQATNQIAFLCQDIRTLSGHASQQICLVNADGTGRRQLTYLPYEVQSLAWSPDGTRIVFTEYDYTLNLSLLATIKIAGSDYKELSRRYIPLTSPRWSPDGSRIAVMSSRYGTSDHKIIESELIIMNIDGSDAKTIIKDIAALPFSWSPDSKRIAYALFEGPKGDELYVMNADGSHRIWLAHLGIGVRFDWARDGTKIVFGCHPRALVCAVNADGSGEIQSSNQNVWLTNSPALSPDGKYFVDSRGQFTNSGIGDFSHLYLIERESLTQIELTTGTWDILPVWRPK